MTSPAKRTVVAAVGLSVLTLGLLGTRVYEPGTDSPTPSSGTARDDFGLSLATDPEVIDEANDTLRQSGRTLPGLEAAGPEESAEIRDAAARHEEVKARVLPSKGTAEALVTPTGASWWSLVTGLAAQVELSGSPTPAGANWYAFSGGTTFGTNADLVPYWTAVHVGFDSPQRAARFTEHVRSARGTDHRYVFERDTVVSVVPASVYPEQETFATQIPVLTAGAPLSRATWSIDWGTKVTAQSAGHRNERALAQMWSALGFDPAGSLWTATADRPEGPWLGTVDGWRADRVDVEAADRIVLGTTGQACQTSEDGTIAMRACVETDEGLSSVLDSIGFTDGESHQMGRLAVAEPPRDGVLAGALRPDGWAEEFLTGRTYDTAVERITFTVDEQSRMLLDVTIESDQNQDEE
ncbi:hypothetical protein [Nocardioides pakistanensis]